MIVISQLKTVWLACVTAMRRFSDEILSMSVLFLHFMNYTSSSAELSSPAIYNSRRTVDFDAVFIEGSNS